MPIIKDGRIQYLNFGTLKHVFKDVKKYLETGHVPSWALELERSGIPHQEVMDEIIIQISNAAVGMHETLKKSIERYRAMEETEEKSNTENPRCPYEPAYRER